MMAAAAPRPAAVLLPLHDARAVGFEAPFEMLAACHERVERSLVLLERLAEHLQARGVDAAARAAAADVLRYFDRAAPAHHEDEERHVLPALRAVGMSALADRIAADHVEMAAAWAARRGELLALVEEGRLPAVAARASWAAFTALYRGHVDLEDHAAYPLARAALDEAARTAMGAEMAARRGLPPAG